MPEPFRQRQFHQAPSPLRSNNIYQNSVSTGTSTNDLDTTFRPAKRRHTLDPQSEWANISPPAFKLGFSIPEHDTPSEAGPSIDQVEPTGPVKAPMGDGNKLKDGEGYLRLKLASPYVMLWRL